MVYTIPIQIGLLSLMAGSSIGVGVGFGYAYDAITHEDPVQKRVVFGVSEEISGSEEDHEIQTINTESQEKNYQCQVGEGELFECALKKPILDDAKKHAELSTFFASQEKKPSARTWAINHKKILKTKDKIYKIFAREEDLKGWDDTGKTISIVNKNTQKKYASIKPWFSVEEKDEKISIAGKTKYFVGQADTALTIAAGSTCSCVFTKIEEGKEEETETASCDVFEGLSSTQAAAAEDTLSGLSFAGLPASTATKIEKHKHYIIKIKDVERDIANLPTKITITESGTGSSTSNLSKIDAVSLGGDDKFMIVLKTWS